MWYISTHKRVPRYLGLMNEYFARQKQALVAGHVESGDRAIILGIVPGGVASCECNLVFSSSW